MSPPKKFIRLVCKLLTVKKVYGNISLQTKTEDDIQVYQDSFLDFLLYFKILMIDLYVYNSLQSNQCQ